jgi:hypothetical protein
MMAPEDPVVPTRRPHALPLSRAQLRLAYAALAQHPDQFVADRARARLAQLAPDRPDEPATAKEAAA